MFIHLANSCHHLPWPEVARPQIILSGVLCGVSVVLCVLINVSCHVAVYVLPPPFSSKFEIGDVKVYLVPVVKKTSVSSEYIIWDSYLIFIKLIDIWCSCIIYLISHESFALLDPVTLLYFFCFFPASHLLIFSVTSLSGITTTGSGSVKYFVALLSENI